MRDESSQNTGQTFDDGTTFELFRLLPTVTTDAAKGVKRQRARNRKDELMLAGHATLSPADSLASQFHVPAGVRLKTIRAGSGHISLEPFVYFDRESCLWRTYQGSLFPVTDSTRSSVIWPRWGLMQNGQCFRRAPLVRLIRASEHSLLPTLRSRESGGRQEDEDGRRYLTLAGVALLPTLTSTECNGGGRQSLTEAELREHKRRTKRTIRFRDVPRRLLPTPTATATATKRGYSGQMEKSNLCPSHAGGPINPEWAEHLMGFPIGWTELEDSATPSCPKSPSGSAEES